MSEQWYRCVCGAFTNDNSAFDDLVCGRHRPDGPLVRHAWQPLPLAPTAPPETREQRTIRRLRALADGYRAKFAPSYATRRKAEAYDRIAKHFKVYDQWAVNYERTVAIAIVAADVRDEAMRTRDEAVELARTSAAEERARIVARLRALAGELRVEAETQGDTVFGTVAAVQEKTIEGLVSIIEKGEASK